MLLAAFAMSEGVSPSSGGVKRSRRASGCARRGVETAATMDVTWSCALARRAGAAQSPPGRGRATVRWRVPAAQLAMLDRLWVPPRGGARDTFEFKVKTRAGAKGWIPVTATLEAVARCQSHWLPSDGAALNARRGIDARERERQAGRLRHLAVVGRLSGALAHELTQHLTSILSNAQAAQRLLSGDESAVEKMRAILTDIISADTHANEVIQRISSLMQRRKTTLETVDLAAAIRGATQLTGRELAAQQVEVVTQIEPDVPTIKGDRVQIEQVLLNLFSNAVQAMRRIPPSRRRLLIRVRRAGASIEVAVKDAGTGLKASERERVFEAFYTTKRKGVGLGLWICRAIVTAHHGRIWISRNKGAGITAHFTLQPAEAAAGHRPLRVPVRQHGSAVPRGNGSIPAAG